MVTPLWPRLIATTTHALASGTLQPIGTQPTLITEHDVPFLIRTLDTLKRKDDAQRRLQQAGNTQRNPFLPWDPALWLCNLSPSHHALLNKFNVIDHHLLIVTRDFESQLSPLNYNDFHALALCLQQIDGLGFYNGGPFAGASQPHKHLQLIPLPMTPCAELPFSPLLARLQGDQPQPCPGLLFNHRALALPAELFNDPQQTADRLLFYHQQLQATLNLNPNNAAEKKPAFNLLITRRWMLLVPRHQESIIGISLNALAFSGAVLLRNKAQLAELKRYGLMRGLMDVC